MFVEIKNMKRFYFFILLIILPFSSQAKINQPYGLFFVQENELKEGQDIFEVPTLKTHISVDNYFYSHYKKSTFKFKNLVLIILGFIFYQI